MNNFNFPTPTGKLTFPAHLPSCLILEKVPLLPGRNGFSFLELELIAAHHLGTLMSHITRAHSLCQLGQATNPSYALPILKQRSPPATTHPVSLSSRKLATPCSHYSWLLDPLQSAFCLGTAWPHKLQG